MRAFTIFFSLLSSTESVLNKLTKATSLSHKGSSHSSCFVSFSKKIHHQQANDFGKLKGKIQTHALTHFKKHHRSFSSIYYTFFNYTEKSDPLIKPDTRSNHKAAIQILNKGLNLTAEATFIKASIPSVAHSFGGR